MITIPTKVLKELKAGDHGDPDLLNHLNKVLDESIHASGLLFKVNKHVQDSRISWKSKLKLKIENAGGAGDPAGEEPGEVEEDVEDALQEEEVELEPERSRVVWKTRSLAQV